ncbi:MAG: hypothetical protein ACLP5V_07655 [Candidatus Bathyarchaeia archaeon]
MTGDSKRQRRTPAFLRRCVRYICIILLTDVAAIAATSILQDRNLFRYFTLLTFFEAAVFFLAGGAVEWGRTRFTSAEDERPQSFDQLDKKKLSAAAYITIGATLLLISYILSYPPN